MKLYTHDKKKNRKVLCGELIGDTLFRNVKKSHFLRIGNGYAIQEVIIDELRREDVKYIVLKETFSEQRWKASLDIWLKKGWIKDLGHGDQRILNVKYMDDHDIQEVLFKNERG